MSRNETLEEEAARLAAESSYLTMKDDAAELVRLRAENERLREALYPFAKHADRLEKNLIFMSSPLTILDLRRASTALTEVPTESDAELVRRENKKLRTALERAETILADALTQAAEPEGSKDWLCSQCGLWHSEHSREHDSPDEPPPAR